MEHYKKDMYEILRHSLKRLYYCVFVCLFCLHGHTFHLKKLSEGDATAYILLMQKCRSPLLI